MQKHQKFVKFWSWTLESRPLLAHLHKPFALFWNTFDFCFRTCKIWH